MNLLDMAALLRPRADSVEIDGSRLWVVATGRRTVADLIATVKAHGLHAGRVEPVVTSNDAEEVFSFLVTPHRLFNAAALRELSGFPDCGYQAGVPYAARRGMGGWCVLAQPDDSPHLLLFVSKSPFTWSLCGTAPRGTGFATVRQVLLNPSDPAIQEKIKAFVAG